MSATRMKRATLVQKKITTRPDAFAAAAVSPRSSAGRTLDALMIAKIPTRTKRKAETTAMIQCGLGSFVALAAAAGAYAVWVAAGSRGDGGATYGSAGGSATGAWLGIGVDRAGAAAAA